MSSNRMEPLTAALLCRTVPLLRGIGEEAVQAILPDIRERHYRKGELIILQGDTGDEIYFIISGAVHIFSFEISKKINYVTLGAGDFFGEMAMINPQQVRSASAEAAAGTRLALLKRSCFERFIASSPRLVLLMLDDIMERLRQANRHIYDMTFLSVKLRTVKHLLQLLKQQEGSALPGRIRITHQELADMVGAVRETVTKVLQELQDQGLLETGSRVLTITDQARLQALLGDRPDD